MPIRNTSYANLLREWECLLEACKANQETLPGVEEVLDPITEAMVQVKTLKLLRQTLTAMAKETTHCIHEAREDGRESARRLRYFVKSRLGTRSEQLPLYGIASARTRPKVMEEERAS